MSEFTYTYLMLEYRTPDNSKIHFKAIKHNDINNLLQVINDHKDYKGLQLIRVEVYKKWKRCRYDAELLNSSIKAIGKNV